MSAATAQTAVTWSSIQELLADRYGACRRWRNGNNWGWWVPTPCGGHLTVEVTLRRRWCSIAVDRWHTTDRDKVLAEPWFKEHIWPYVKAACESRRTRQRGGYGVLPSGGPTWTSAHPIDRADLPEALTAWIDAELTWPGHGVDRGQL